MSVKESFSPSNIIDTIQINRVSKVYNLEKAPVHALKEVSFDIQPGSFVSIVGKSGSGKSTLLNLIAGMDLPSSGEIVVKGKVVSKMIPAQLAKYRQTAVGMIFQAFNLINSLTALENVALPLLFSGVEEEERLSRAQKCLASVELSHRLNHKPLELSGGEQQRVAIARALINDPFILLADEPTGNLDSSTSSEIVDLLKNIHNEGRTIFMITHDLQLSEQLSTRIITLKDGQIESDRYQELAACSS